MAKNLVIVESPAKAKTIKRYLGGDFQVAPSVGHVVDLPKSKLGVDIKKGFAPDYQIIPAKAKVVAPSDLADQVERRLRTRLLAALGLARKAGDLTFGFERVLAAVAAGKAAWLVEATDGSDEGARKLMAAARHAQTEPRMLRVFDSSELSLALGARNVIHTAFLAGRGAQRWTVDVERLAGFRPLFP